MKLTVAHVYPDLLNLYGDSGNVLCIKKRCEWRGIECDVRNFEAGSQFDFGSCDIVFIGGGQDREQQLVLRSLGVKMQSASQMPLKTKPCLQFAEAISCSVSIMKHHPELVLILREFLIFIQSAGKIAL